MSDVASAFNETCSLSRNFFCQISCYRRWALNSCFLFHNLILFQAKRSFSHPSWGACYHLSSCRGTWILVWARKNAITGSDPSQGLVLWALAFLSSPIRVRESFVFHAFFLRSWFIVQIYFRKWLYFTNGQLVRPQTENIRNITSLGR